MEWAVIFAGVQATLMLYLQTRLGQRTEMRADNEALRGQNEALRAENKDLRTMLKDCESAAREMWQARYKHLEGLNANEGRPVENQDG